MYLDTCYIAKFYWNEPNSSLVRELVRGANKIQSSAWALPEFHAVLHRRIREGLTTAEEATDLATRFSSHAKDGLWNFVPVNEALLRRTSLLLISAPRDIFLRAADAVHLTTAQELGEREIWTSHGCKVTRVNVTNPFVTQLSPHVAVLTFNATADGTCFDQPIGPIWGTSVYRKTNDQWKWTFGINTPALTNPC